MANTEIVINPDKIQTFFTEIETRKALLTKITDLHKALIANFDSLSQTLTLKTQTLDSQIEFFNSHSRKSLESLENRQNAIPEQESLAIAQIEERKVAAFLDIEGKDDSEDQELGEILRVYFRRMDASGLISFMLAKRKESVLLREEIALAVDEAVDAMSFVLDAVEEFLGMKIEGKVGMADRRWACSLLILVALPPPGLEEGVLVARSLKERAVKVLEKWKGVLGGGEGSGGVGAGEASMFLQVVIGFGLKEMMGEEVLRKLILEFAGRRDMAKLAVALGFVGDKMGDVINELVKSGKEIEAVYFTSESGLTEQFSPVSLLKSCLKNCRKSANSVSKSGNYSTAAVEEANNSELIATRAILKCIEDHKLESQFSVESLKKRITQIERVKADKKKSVAPFTSKPSNKRTRGGNSRGGGGGPSSRPPKAGRFSNNSPAFRQRNPPQSHQIPPARFAAQYNHASPTMYDRPSTPLYVAKYGGALAQSPARVPPPYPYAPPDVEAVGTRAAASYLGQGPYGGSSSYAAAHDYPAGHPTYPPSYPG